MSKEPSLEPLRGFLRAARGGSQEQIIIEFLDTVVNQSSIADHGSVLINHPRNRKLVVFNEGDFLFQKRLLDANKRADWPKEFSYFDSSYAGRCFREKETQIFDREVHKTQGDFFGTSPIQNMICVPIITGSGDPFGVVCLHNNDPNRKFLEDDKKAIEFYVNVLALALHTPHPELQLENNVFIVHGRDEKSLNDLRLLLLENKVTPRVLAREDKKATSILQSLEDLIRICKAGFILATPDDEGRLNKPGDLALPRARENVIFETGLLFAKYRQFDRVGILLKKPLTLPSDLAGIFVEEFTNISDIEMRIVTKLKNWGLLGAPQA